MVSASGKGMAYDLSMFEEKKPKQYRPAAARAKAEQNSIDLSKIVTFVVFLATLAAILLSYAQLNEISSQVAGMKNQLNVLQEEEKRMSVSLEEKTSLKKVDEYARTVLGMTDVSQSQMQYIVFQNEDRVEVYQSSQGLSLLAISDRVVKSFNAVVEYLK
jgi:hypothetical protein